MRWLWKRHVKRIIHRAESSRFQELSQQDLLSRQEKLERLIAELEPFMPKKELLESLKEEPLELSFAALEQAGKARDEVALLEGISKQLKVLQEAKSQIEADLLEVAALEKWSHWS